MDKVALLDIEVRLECIEARQERIEGKLDRICAYLDRIESAEYQLGRDAKEMVINLVANVFANSRLENNNQ